MLTSLRTQRSLTYGRISHVDVLDIDPRGRRCGSPPSTRPRAVSAMSTPLNRPPSRSPGRRHNSYNNARIDMASIYGLSIQKRSKFALLTRTRPRDRFLLDHVRKLPSQGNIFARYGPSDWSTSFPVDPFSTSRFTTYKGRNKSTKRNRQSEPNLLTRQPRSGHRHRPHIRGQVTVDLVGLIHVE